MKSPVTLFLSILFLSAIDCNAQIFWSENFESGSAAGLAVPGYTGPNGTWTLTTSISSAEGDAPNVWYVSCAEAGHLAGGCGSVCGGGTGETGATLHIGSGSGSLAGPDNGASYDAGGFCGTLYCVQTDRRAESPTINCTGKSNINLRFYYIENGQGTTDDGWVEYYDGTSWSLLINTAKTSLCGAQGLWAVQNITLPVSANNNPNIKIGFRWINNDDGVGTDPSYAIDSVSLSTTVTVAAPVASFFTSAESACMDSCITFTSTSTGTIDSVRWVMPGVTIPTPHDTSITICNFPAAGFDTMRLYVYGPGGEDSTKSVITINPLPHPTITHVGNLLSAGNGYSQYIWSKNGTVITGATTDTFRIPHSGTYTVAVDSNGCWGYDSLFLLQTGVPIINSANGGAIWVSSAVTSSINIYSLHVLNDDIKLGVYDIAGKLVLNATWQAGTNSKQIEVPSLPAGSYIIKLSDQNSSGVLKWSKR